MIRLKSDFKGFQDDHHEVIIHDKDWDDSSAVGVADDITVANPVWSDNNLVFDGTNQSNFIIQDNILSGDISISLRFKVSSIVSAEGNQRIFSQGGNDSGDTMKRILFITNNGILYWVVYNGIDFDRLILDFNIIEDTWYHIVIMEFNEILYGYVNGEYIGQQSVTPPSEYIYDTQAAIGRIYWGTSYFFNGFIEDLRIFDFQLTKNDILKLYNFKYEILATETGHWIMTEGSGYTLYDYSTAKKLLLKTPCYELNWDAGITDVVKGGIITSGCSIFMQNKNDELDNFFNDIMVSDESRFLVEIKKNKIVIWRGVLLQNFSGINDKPYYNITIEAVDGFSALKSIEVTYSNDYSFLDYIIQGLQELDIYSVWYENADILYVVLDWWAENMNTTLNPLDGSKPFGNIWAKEEEKEVWINGQKYYKTETMFYYEVIEHILERFNAVLMLSEGVWRLFQRDLLYTENLQWWKYKRGNPFSGDHIIAAGAIVLTSFFQIGKTYDKYRSDGNIDYLSGLKKVNTKLIVVAAGNLMQLNPELDVEYDLTNVEAEADSLVASEVEFNISLDFIEKFLLGLSGGAALYKAQAYYKLTVKITAEDSGDEDHYLYNNNGNLDWVAASVWTGSINFNSFFSPDMLDDEDGTEFSLQTIFDLNTLFTNYYPVIPISGMLSIKVSRNGTNCDPLPLITLTTQQVTINTYSVIFETEGEPPLYTVNYNANNDNQNYSLIHELSESIFGSKGGLSKSLISIYNGVSWVTPINGIWRKGDESSSGSHWQFFNELLASEILLGQDKPLLMFSGTIINRSTDNLLANQAIVLYIKGNWFHFLLNRIIYNPKEEKYEGDWIEFRRTEAVVNPNIIPFPIPIFPVEFKPIDMVAGITSDVVADIDDGFISEVITISNKSNPIYIDNNNDESVTFTNYPSF